MARTHPVSLCIATALATGLIAVVVQPAQAEEAQLAWQSGDLQQPDESAADRAVQQAQQNLAAAERALQAGRTPLPGERRGNVNGTSRLLPAYFDRIAALEQAVETAKQQLNDAYAERRGQ